MSSKTSSPYVSKISLICARTSSSPRLSRVTPLHAGAEAEIVADGPHGDGGHGWLLTGSRLSCRPSRRVVDEQRPAHEERTGLLDSRSTIVPLVVAPRRLDQLGARQTLGERFGGGPGVRHVGRAAAEHEDRDVEAGDVVVVESGDERVVARAVGQHPAVHHVEELLAVHREETAARLRGLRASTSCHWSSSTTASIPPCHAASADGMQ